MKRSEIFFSAITVPLDFCVLIVAAITAYQLRYLPSIQAIRPVTFDLPFNDFIFFANIAAIGWVLIFALVGLYQMRSTHRWIGQLRQIFIGCSVGLAFVLAFMVFTRYLFDSRFIILVSWSLAILFISIERLLVRLVQRWLFKFGIGMHRVVVIGSGATVDYLTNVLRNQTGLGYTVVRTLDTFGSKEEMELTELVANDGFDEIIYINNQQASTEVAAVLAFANEHHIGYQYSAGLLDTQRSNLVIKTIGDLPIIELEQTRLEGWGRVYKRLFDIIASAALITLFSPLMVLVMIAIKLDSRGPIFFHYQRIGQHGKPFMYFKFRSMIDNAHQYRFDEKFLAEHPNVRNGTPMLKFKNDPRITRVGHIIRRWSIDELPELFLAFIGRMSLVGPRPHEIQEVGKYQKHHKKLLTIKPGVTGLAQVSGRSDLDFEQEVRLDTFYIEQWSLGLDIHILLRTPLAVIQRRSTL